MRRARRGGWIGIALALLLCAGCGTAGTTTQQPGPAVTQVRPSSTTTTQVDDRPVQFYVPASRPSGPAALVIALHGYTGNAAGVVAYFGLRPLADERGFVIAAPQGTTDADGRSFWDAARACCNFGGPDVDDAGFLGRMITTAIATQGIDPARVYVVGHSNGGFMAHRLACEHADKVAAIASLAGALDEDTQCQPARPVSVLQVHGTADETISYEGGTNGGAPYTSAEQTVASWRDLDRCDRDRRAGRRLDADADVEGDDLTPTTWSGCDAGAEVALWTIKGGGHNPALTPAFGSALFDWFEAHQRTG